MPQIAPFRGIFYNQQVVPDLATAICPPYDIIDHRLQRDLYNCGRYNCVRLEHGLECAGDNYLENKYSRAAASFEAWLHQGVLKQADFPAFYLHQQHFRYRGQHHVRHNLVARVRLAQWSEGSIRPHENTLSSAKSDRLNLLQACKASFSPIFALYEDPDSSIASAIAELKERAARPLVQGDCHDGDLHRVDAITQPDAIARLRELFRPLTFYVADGHHRYETALNYRKEVQAASSQHSEEEPSNFIMMALASFSDPEVVTLPTHRVLRGLSPSRLEGLKQKLGEVFNLEAFPLGQIEGDELPERLLRVLEPRGKEEIALGVIGLERGKLLVLRAKRQSCPQQMMPPGASEAYRMLDVSILQHVVLDGMLPLAEEQAKGDVLTYTHSEAEALHLVQEGSYQIAFLLNPIEVLKVKTVADANDKMPLKSTYFYPKIPAGLVINSLTS